MIRLIRGARGCEFSPALSARNGSRVKSGLDQLNSHQMTLLLVGGADDECSKEPVHENE